MLSVQEMRAIVNSLSVNKAREARCTPQAEQLYRYLKVRGPATRKDLMRELWGPEYLLAPWRENFRQHLCMARRLAACYGEAIVPAEECRDAPLQVVRLESEVQ